MYPRLNNPKPKIDYLEMLVCFIFMSAFAIVIYFLIQPIPIVKISTSTGRCVAVEIEGKDYDCSCFNDLNGRYDTEFVK